MIAYTPPTPEFAHRRTRSRSSTLVEMVEGRLGIQHTRTRSRSTSPETEEAAPRKDGGESGNLETMASYMRRRTSYYLWCFPLTVSLPSSCCKSGGKLIRTAFCPVYHHHVSRLASCISCPCPYLTSQRAIHVFCCTTRRRYHGGRADARRGHRPGFGGHSHIRSGRASVSIGSTCKSRAMG
jgi:hypothetical protein